MQSIVDQVKSFVRWARPQLGLHGRIQIRLTRKQARNGNQHTFGYFDIENNCIVVCVRNRHINDVLRTVAHEIIHLAQHQRSPLGVEDGRTGSNIENQANAVAGVLMRKWNNKSNNN
jgi:Zn-dependent peptidase ImmA (M78 family)